jgi:hypothetical protein
MSRVLAFDIGIKNLAWCVLDVSGETYQIFGWDNYNLLEDSSNVAAKVQAKCAMCSMKPTYTTNEQQTCVRHCPTDKPALRDCSGMLLKKIPKMETCKEMLSAKGLTKVPSKKADIVAALQLHWSMPLETKKVSKAPDVGLTEIHNSLQRLVSQQSILWSTCDMILLENQPVFKNPTMKSVQILLFATLRDRLKQPPPQLKLVHAGKKVKGAVKGDAGYKDRKAGSEARADIFLKNSKLQESSRWQQVYHSAAKKSDLADALSMCVDYAIPAA